MGLLIGDEATSILDREARQIALHAIAARATGNPVEAAKQILAGFSALDAKGKPLVVWPQELSFSDQVAALEAELARIRQIQQDMADFQDRVNKSNLERCLGYPNDGNRAPASDEPGPAAEGQPVPHEEGAKADLPSELLPGREANGVSQ